MGCRANQDPEAMHKLVRSTQQVVNPFPQGSTRQQGSENPALRIMASDAMKNGNTTDVSFDGHQLGLGPRTEQPLGQTSESSKHLLTDDRLYQST